MLSPHFYSLGSAGLRASPDLVKYLTSPSISWNRQGCEAAVVRVSFSSFQSDSCYLPSSSTKRNCFSAILRLIRQEMHDAMWHICGLLANSQQNQLKLNKTTAPRSWRPVIVSCAQALYLPTLHLQDYLLSAIRLPLRPKALRTGKRKSLITKQLNALLLDLRTARFLGKVCHMRKGLVFVRSNKHTQHSTKAPQRCARGPSPIAGISFLKSHVRHCPTGETSLDITFWEIMIEIVNHNTSERIRYGKLLQDP